MPTGNTNGGIHASEACGPFDSEDRRQPARNLRTMLATVVRDNGVAGGVQDEMEITQSTPQTLSVQVGSGGALLGDPEDQLYWYDNPSAFTFDDFTTPHASQARIDLLGILLDTSDPADLYGGVQVITGTPAGSPQRPSHNHGDNFVELAQIRVPGGASRIVNGNITDTRGYIERTTFQQLRDSLIFTGIARRTVDSNRNQITVNVPATNIPSIPDAANLRIIDSGGGYINTSGTATLTTSLSAGRVLHVSVMGFSAGRGGTGMLDSSTAARTIIGFENSNTTRTIANLRRSGTTATLSPAAYALVYNWTLMQS